MTDAQPAPPIDESDPVAEGEPPTPLVEPRDGVPDVIVDASALPAVAAALANGTGPVAIDAERASGYRYGQRAYLVQIRRTGSGTFLIDPIGTGSLKVLDDVLRDVEWVLHAATQDLPCLAELDLAPTLLFDTELAGRLAGKPRVGLGPLVEQSLGLALEKGHGAADWSTRPLPEPWLRYAALDVEVLVELRDAIAADLSEQGKLEWAEQEFAAIVAAPPPPSKVEPWRRTSGLQKVRTPAQLAIVRELWEERDAIAQRRDVAPGRVLGDAAIVEAAHARPTSQSALAELATFRGRGAQRHLRAWWSAIERAAALPAKDFPNSRAPLVGPPPPRAWADRDPAAAARLSSARHLLSVCAEAHNLPVENLLTPDLVRRLCWEPPTTIDEASVTARLAEGRARPWQIALTAELLTVALTAQAAEPAVAPPVDPSESVAPEPA